MTDKATMVVACWQTQLNGGRSVGDPIEAKAESSVAIIGTPAVVLELVTPAECSRSASGLCSRCGENGPSRRETSR